MKDGKLPVEEKVFILHGYWDCPDHDGVKKDTMR